jgi:PAS domain S-box-containing protein
MTLPRRVLRWVAVVVLSLALIACGVWVAWRRVDSEQARLRALFMEDAEELARSVEPGLLGQLALDSSDLGTAAYRRLGDLFAACDLLNPERTAFLVSTRDGELRLGAISRGEQTPGPLSFSDVALTIADYRSLERTGQATLFGTGSDDADPMIVALAPVVAPSTGVVVGGAGLQLPQRQWRAASTSVAWPPLITALLASALLMAAYGTLDWRSKQSPNMQQRWLHLETGLTGLACVLVTAVVTVYIVRIESQQRKELFTAVARTRVSSLQAELGGIQTELDSLARFFESSAYVSREEFAGFVSPVSTRGIVAIEWAPRVEASATSLYQTLARQEGLAGYKVWELDAAGQRQPVSGRESYYPIFYVEPLSGNDATLGFDLGSEAARSRAIARASAEGLTTASEPLSLLRPDARGWGMLVFEPVTRGDGITAGDSSDGLPQQGFVVAVLDWVRLVESTLATSASNAGLVALDIVDLQMEEGTGPLLLASSQARNDSDSAIDSVGYRFADTRTGDVVPILAFGRALAIAYRPAEALSELQPLRTSPAAAVAGLSLGGILTLVVGLLRQRETTLQRLVAERTTALSEREAHYRALFEEALNPILVADADGQFVDANDAALTYLQRNRDELVGKRLWDLAPRTSLQRTSRAQTPFGLRRTVEADLQVGARVKTLLLNIIPVKQSGRSTLFAIGQDITERKLSESALQRRYAFERTLAAASSRFVGEVSYDAAVNDTLADIGTLSGAGRAYLFTVDDNGRTVTNTHEWCAPGVESQRLQRQQVPGEQYSWWMERLGRGETVMVPDVERMGTESQGAQSVLLAQSIRSLVVLPVFVQGNLRGFVGLDNVETPGTWEAEDTSLLGTFAEILSSYLERVSAQDGRLDLERQLLQSQKLESLGVLAGGIAHDFNNLLAAILGNLELARLDLPQNSPARLSLDESVSASLRAADLTRQMLAYSGKGHFVVSDVDLSALVEENRQIFRTAIPRTATLDLKLARNLPQVRGDPGQLQQVVMNLLGNAAEALDGGPGQVALTTGSARYTAAALARSRTGEPLAAGDYVWLEVRDTGQGMDEETQSRMFDPFFTTKQPGRGLGLGAVLGIIRGHQGGIWVESTPGGGTLVRVALPAVSRAVSPDKSDAATGRTIERLSGGILVVDDEESVRRVNSHVLERMGLRTFVAASGEEAVALYGRHRDEIDCVLLDLTMPGMDGVATLEALRQANPSLKAVLCTGYGEQVASERFRGLGLSGFVQKPFQISELRAVLEQALRAP